MISVSHITIGNVSSLTICGGIGTLVCPVVDIVLVDYSPRGPPQITLGELI